ncbi:MAG: KUP/HAK/KT family potassium transporter [Isosphaeraceae bacterium]
MSEADASGTGHSHGHGHGAGLFTRMREATGTVYGDIGTSVLYTFMEITRETVLLKHEGKSPEAVAAMLEAGGPLISQAEALGGLSLVFWALIVLTVKYDLLIMRADNRGEGGTFALWALLKGVTGKVVGITMIGYLVVAAGALLAADGVITPPISMLGAYEPLGEHWAVAVTIVSLIVLFKAQWRGTSQVGGFFGWFMMLVWFPWIALKGLPWVLGHPEVFQALNPAHALTFLWQFPGAGAFVILGVVVLAITGGEAKYADIGHFARKGEEEAGQGESLDPKDSGRRPVMYSWFALVLPCLLCNYAGQVAYVLERGVPPRANTYYALTPMTGQVAVDGFILGADLVVSAIAAFIASQALITGMFSIVKQAIALGFCPRFDVKFTSREAEGQVYIPAVNWAMFLGCLVITLTFRTAGHLAAAYGIAVTGTMGITTLAFGYVAHYRWGWSLARVAAVCTPILAVDLIFFASNLLKFMHGGYAPVAIAAVLVTVMLTWQSGRAELARAFYAFGVEGGKHVYWLVALRDKLDEIRVSVEENLPQARSIVQGRRRLGETDRAFVFLCSRPVRDLDDYLPVPMRIFLKKYGVLPAHVTFFHVNQVPVAEAPGGTKVEVVTLGRNIVGVSGSYGYMERPDVRGALHELQRRGEINIPSERWIIVVGEEELIIDDDVPLLRRSYLQLFRLILRLSTPAHRFFGLGYDAGVSKELIPVEFGRDAVRVTLPELEIVEPPAKSLAPAGAGGGHPSM